MLHWFLKRKRRKRKKRNQAKQKRTRTKTGPPERRLRPSETPVQVDQSTGNFTANSMIQCINEIKQVKAEAAAKGQLPKLSRNKIQAKQYLCPLLPRLGALFVEFADISRPGTSSYGLLVLCLHLCLLLLLPFHPLHLIYPLKQGGNLLDLFSSETGATIQRL